MEFTGKAFLYTEDELESMTSRKRDVTHKQHCDTCVYGTTGTCTNKSIEVRNKATVELGGCHRYDGRNSNDA